MKRAMYLTLTLALALPWLATGCGGGSSATNTGGTGGLNDFAGSSGATVLMAVSGFSGTSRIAGFEGWIELGSLDLSVIREFAQSAKAGTADLFTGVSDARPLAMTKPIDGTSTKFLEAACGGGAIGGQQGKMTLVALAPASASGAMDANSARRVVYRVDLTAPIVASFQQAMGDSNEDLSIWYYTIKTWFWELDPKTHETNRAARYYASWDRTRRTDIPKGDLPVGADPLSGVPSPTLPALNAVPSDCNMLMRLPGLARFNGDSQLQGFEHWINVESVDWGANREFAESAKAGTQDLFTGVSTLTPLHVSKFLDSSSLSFLQAAFTGIAPQSSLTLVGLASNSLASSSEPRNSITYRIDLGNPIISSFDQSVADSTETVGIWYRQLKLTTYSLGPGSGGSPGSSRTYGWDRQTNRALNGDVTGYINPFTK